MQARKEHVPLYILGRSFWLCCGEWGEGGRNGGRDSDAILSYYLLSITLPCKVMQETRAKEKRYIGFGGQLEVGGGWLKENEESK